ncbi:MAG TPA: hypothetical protein V6D11_21065 [Waterburya sp.]|jgi:hypothetical protein
MKQEVLSAAVIGAAVVIGLMVGFSITYAARSLLTAPSGSESALPQWHSASFTEQLFA